MRRRSRGTRPAEVVLGGWCLALLCGVCQAQQWLNDVTNGNPQIRHEACTALVNNRLYLIGGRGQKMVNEYDIATKTWTILPWTRPQISLHHMKCVPFDGKIWIAGAYAGAFPRETVYPNMWVFDPSSNTWSTRDFLPANPERRRSGAAFMLDERTNLMYLSHGVKGGHGPGSTILSHLDVYDPVRDVWNPNGLYPDGPNPRGHTGGAVVEGKVCVAQGRNDSSADFYNSAIGETDCFDLSTELWTVEDSIPVLRAGGSAGKTCNGDLVILGGQGYGQAFDEMDLFKPSIGWRSGPTMLTPRHASDMAVGPCPSCGLLFVTSGNAGQGGALSLTSTQRYVPAGVSATCGSPAAATTRPATTRSAATTTTRTPTTRVPISTATTRTPSPSTLSPTTRPATIPGDYLYVNCGSPQDPNSLVSGNTRKFVAGGPSIDGEADRRYNSHRWGIRFAPSFTYSLDASRARRVTIGFAETWPPNCVTGKRVFTVSINGNVVAANLDVFSESGCRASYEISNIAQPDATGKISINFDRGIGGAENPMVSYIQLADV